ncbi:MAG: hypothetical protein AABY15_05045 [Nanoarchaeota archaeon]
MAEPIVGLWAEIILAYNGFLSNLPLWVQDFISLFLLVIFAVAYSIIIWKFYRFIGRKNILRLNLNQYSKLSHLFLERMLGWVLYFLEYIIIIPFLIFFWFAVFTLFLILLTEGIEIDKILMISAIVIAAVRMTAYYKEDLSKELAKLLPLNLLAIAMLTEGLFNFERILGNFSQLSVFFNEIIIYLLFIVVLEIILRFFDFIFSMFGLEEEGEEKEA